MAPHTPDLQADPDFRVTTSRRPSDIDMSQEFNAYVRASFSDFQLESVLQRALCTGVMYLMLL